MSATSAARDVPLTMIDAAEALRGGHTTSVDLTRAYLQRADVLDPVLGAYVTRLDETALEDAEKVDRERARGVDRGLLHGIPIGIKDILCTAGSPTTANSLVADPSRGAGRDAAVVRALKAAGAVIIGKLTTMEFAIGLCDTDKPFAIPRNPWDLAAWPGGSSSGSGSGVAAGLFPGAIGTDTGGSIRIPAAFCGVTGLKPTFGRVSTQGCLPFGFTLDHVGPLARTARDCAGILQVIAGPVEGDPVAVPDFAAEFGPDLTAVRVGVARSQLGDDPVVRTAFEQAMGHLRDSGARLVDIDVPLYSEVGAAVTLTMATEAFAYHRDSLRSRWQDYSAGTRQFVASGAFVTAADYVQAQRVRRAGQHALAQTFRAVDVIAMPTVTRAAPSYRELDERGLMAVYAETNTAYWDGVGNPALALPMGMSEGGLPLSLQLAGRPFEEGTVLRVGHAFQSTSDWHLATPDPLASYGWAR